MALIDSFRTLLARIQPLGSEKLALANHLATVRTRLSSTFKVNKFVTVGSSSRGTSIRGKSDGDLFVVFPRDQLRWGDSYVSSNTALENIKKELQMRYKYTNIYKDVHSIVIDFSACSIDVVPAFYYETTRNGWPVYAMPDGGGGWMKTCPELHAKYIKAADEQSWGKLKRTAQLIKFWRECRHPRVPISSFYIEMLLAFEGTCKGIKSYDQCLRNIFQSIASKECRAMRDPLGLTSYISCVKTESQRESALLSVRYSRDHAKAGYQAAISDNIVEANRQWDIVFNGNFPY